MAHSLLQTYFILFYLVPLIIYIIDILCVTLNTGFYDRGILEKDRNKIALNYAKKFLLYDVLFFFPYLIALSTDISILEIFVLFRIPKLI